MTSVTAKAAGIKSPNLVREGAALQRAVSAELDWVRQSAKGKGKRVQGSELSRLGSGISKPKGGKKSTKKK
jgi:hypothetical protein